MRPVGTCVLSGAPIRSGESVVLIPLVPSELASRRVPALREDVGTTWLGDNSQSTGLFQPLTLPLRVKVAAVGTLGTLTSDSNASFLSERLGDMGAFAGDVLFGNAHEGVMRFSPRRVRGSWRGELFGALVCDEAWQAAAPRRAKIIRREAQIEREAADYRAALGRDKRWRKLGNTVQQDGFDIVSSSAPASFVEMGRQRLRANIAKFFRSGNVEVSPSPDFEAAMRAAMPPEGFEQAYAMTDRARRVTWTVRLRIRPDDIHLSNPSLLGVDRSPWAKPKHSQHLVSLLPREKFDAFAHFGDDVWAALRETGWRPNRETMETRFRVGPMTSRWCSPEMRRIYRGALFGRFRRQYVDLAARLDALTALGRLVMPSVYRGDVTDATREFEKRMHRIALAALEAK